MLENIDFQKDIRNIKDFIASQQESLNRYLSLINNLKSVSKEHVINSFNTSPNKSFEDISLIYNNVILLVPSLFAELSNLMFAQKEIFFSSKNNLEAISQMNIQMDDLSSMVEYKKIFFSSNYPNLISSKDFYNIYVSILSISGQMLELYTKLLNYCSQVLLYILN